MGRRPQTVARADSRGVGAAALDSFFGGGEGGVCGVRIFWIKAIFPMHRTFRSILLAYPISLATTTVLIIAALLICRPAHKFAARSGEQT